MGIGASSSRKQQLASEVPSAVHVQKTEDSGAVAAAAPSVTATAPAKAEAEPTKSSASALVRQSEDPILAEKPCDDAAAAAAAARSLVSAEEPSAAAAAASLCGAEQAADVDAGRTGEAIEGGSCTAELVRAVEVENWQEAERILRENPPEESDPDARTTDWGYSVLRAAAEEAAESLCRLLVERKADVNARDHNAMTPLMGCIVGGDCGGIVSMLLEARADAEAVTDDGFTALKWATRLNREESIKILRDAGMTGDATCF